MYVTVHIHARPAVTLLRIPEQALRPGKTVWLVREGKLVRRRVEVVDVQGDVNKAQAIIYAGPSLEEKAARAAMSCGMAGAAGPAMFVNFASVWEDWWRESYLGAGDRVVTSPLSEAVAGMEVREEEAQ